jgi:prepilin-type N-terminal cleavage/methylation domain-containing protein
MDLKIAKRQAGFTLIEIIISIFIVTLLLGVATMSFQSIQEEGKLKNEGVAVKLAARKLMRQAVEKNQSYTMTLAPGFFATGPSYSNQSLESTYIGSGEDLERELRTIKGQQHAFEDGIQLWVRRWTEPDFRPPARPFERWQFEPGGICEPLSLRLTYGDAWMDMTFNPLTAHVDDESLVIPN